MTEEIIVLNMGNIDFLSFIYFNSSIWYLEFQIEKIEIYEE